MGSVSRAGVGSFFFRGSDKSSENIDMLASKFNVIIGEGDDVKVKQQKVVYLLTFLKVKYGHKDRSINEGDLTAELEKINLFLLGDDANEGKKLTIEQVMTLINMGTDRQGWIDQNKYQFTRSINELLEILNIDVNDTLRATITVVDNFSHMRYKLGKCNSFSSYEFINATHTKEEKIEILLTKFNSIQEKHTEVDKEKFQKRLVFLIHAVIVKYGMNNIALNDDEIYQDHIEIVKFLKDSSNNDENQITFIDICHLIQICRYKYGTPPTPAESVLQILLQLRINVDISENTKLMIRENLTVMKKELETSSGRLPTLFKRIKFQEQYGEFIEKKVLGLIYAESEWVLPEPSDWGIFSWIKYLFSPVIFPVNCFITYIMKPRSLLDSSVNKENISHMDDNTDNQIVNEQQAANNAWISYVFKCVYEELNKQIILYDLETKNDDLNMEVIDVVIRKVINEVQPQKEAFMRMNIPNAGNNGLNSGDNQGIEESKGEGKSLSGNKTNNPPPQGKLVGLSQKPEQVEYTVEVEQDILHIEKNKGADGSLSVNNDGKTKTDGVPLQKESLLDANLNKTDGVNPQDNSGGFDFFILPEEKNLPSEVQRKPTKKLQKLLNNQVASVLEQQEKQRQQLLQLQNQQLFVNPVK